MSCFKVVFYMHFLKFTSDAQHAAEVARSSMARVRCRLNTIDDCVCFLQIPFFGITPQPVNISN